MSLITKAHLNKYKQQYVSKSASATVLESKASRTPKTEEFDIFLSHSYKDAQALDANELRAIAELLNDYGFSVYVDWIVDRQLNRENVSPETANILRIRMKSCKSLLFATTENSSSSKWMPWELGYKDGDNGKAAILPIVNQAKNNYKGQEYLGIYPFIDMENTKQGTSELWVTESNGAYVSLRAWIKSGTKPYKR